MTTFTEARYTTWYEVMVIFARKDGVQFAFGDTTFSFNDVQEAKLKAKRLMQKFPEAQKVRIRRISEIGEEVREEKEENA